MKSTLCILLEYQDHIGLNKETVVGYLKREYQLFVTMVIDFNDIAEWIFTKGYFIMLVRNYFPNLTSLFSSSVRDSFTQSFNIWISNRTMGNS